MQQIALHGQKGVGKNLPIYELSMKHQQGNVMGLMGMELYPCNSEFFSPFLILSIWNLHSQEARMPIRNADLPAYFGWRIGCKDKSQLSPVTTSLPFRMYGQPCATYESASLRMFHLGRTDTIRSASTSSLKFVEAMDKPNKQVRV